MTKKTTTLACCVFCLLMASCLVAQTLTTATTVPSSPARDTQAVAAVTYAIAAMGGLPPSDSVATGTVHLAAGSKTEDGTIRIATRGLKQSSEQIQTPSGTQTFLYDDSFASENLRP